MSLFYKSILCRANAVQFYSWSLSDWFMCENLTPITEFSVWGWGLYIDIYSVFLAGNSWYLLFGLEGEVREFISRLKYLLRICCVSGVVSDVGEYAFVHFAFTLKKQTARIWSVGETESCCFEGIVSMAVKSLGKKPFLLKILPSLQTYRGGNELQHRNLRGVLLTV